MGSGFLAVTLPNPLVIPAFVAAAPGWIAPLFHSEVTVGALAALLLNALLGIGVKQRAALAYDPRSMSHAHLHDFFEEQGSAWGARCEVVGRATVATLEGLVQDGLTDGPIQVEASFDE